MNRRTFMLQLGAVLAATVAAKPPPVGFLHTWSTAHGCLSPGTAVTIPNSFSFWGKRDVSPYERNLQLDDLAQAMDPDFCRRLNLTPREDV